MVKPDQPVSHIVSLGDTNSDISATIFTSCFFVCVAFVPHHISSITSEGRLWAWLPDKVATPIPEQFL